jgi:hypothetical protein
LNYNKNENKLEWNLSENTLHHGQVLTVAVRLKQSDASKELKDDATERPDVTRL